MTHLARAIAATLICLAAMTVPATAIARTDAQVAARSGIPTPVVTVIHENCPYMDASQVSTGACSYPDGRVYLPYKDAFTREHELGHQFDLQYLDAGERLALKRAMRLPLTRPWVTGAGMTGLNSPNEKFADLYASCRLGRVPGVDWDTAYDYQPSPRDFARACGVLRRAGKDPA